LLNPVEKADFIPAIMLTILAQRSDCAFIESLHIPISAKADRHNMAPGDFI
jgi:hypothetical protein